MSWFIITHKALWPPRSCLLSNGFLVLCQASLILSGPCRPISAQASRAEGLGQRPWRLMWNLARSVTSFLGPHLHSWVASEMLPNLAPCIVPHFCLPCQPNPQGAEIMQSLSQSLPFTAITLCKMPGCSVPQFLYLLAYWENSSVEQWPFFSVNKLMDTKYRPETGVSIARMIRVHLSSLPFFPFTVFIFLDPSSGLSHSLNLESNPTSTLLWKLVWDLVHTIRTCFFPQSTCQIGHGSFSALSLQYKQESHLPLQHLSMRMCLSFQSLHSTVPSKPSPEHLAKEPSWSFHISVLSIHCPSLHA